MSEEIALPTKIKDDINIERFDIEKQNFITF